MFTVALIGGDGAGKTTVARAVMQSSGLPMKYVYLGLSTRSSNHALPTSRLVLLLKKRMYRREMRNPTGSAAGDIPASQLEYAENTHGWVWNTARFLNRLAEAWYRQVLSVIYQWRGYVVLYDRHFFFDTAPGAINAQEEKPLLLDRLLYWLMTHFYPRPTLTIFLDAPPELLFQRKGEATPEYLDQQRSTFLRQGKKLAHFIRVDASQPLDDVINEVTSHIKSFYALRQAKRSGAAQGETASR